MTVVKGDVRFDGQLESPYPSFINAFVAGSSASVGSDGNVAIGRIANASGASNVAIGEGAQSGGNAGVAVGDNSNAGFTNTGSTPFGTCTAIGTFAAATGGSSVAVGHQASARGQGGVALGKGADSGSGDRATVIGRSATASVADSVAIGYASVVGNEGSIALGKSATTSVARQFKAGSDSAWLEEVNLHQGTNGQQTLIKTATTELGDLSASATAAGLVPAGAVVLGLTTRVTGAVTGASTYDIGDGSDQDRWGAGISGALGTTSDNSDWTVGSIDSFPSGSDIVLTGDVAFTGGSVRITVHYMLPVAPAS